MTVIQMNVAQAEQTIQTLRQAHDHLHGAIQSLVRTVADVEESWEGQTKQQFAAAWQEWLSGFNQVLAVVPPLADGIQREKEQLQAADAASNYA